MQSLISFLESMPSPFASHISMTSDGDGPCLIWARLAKAALSSFLLSLPSPLTSTSAKCSSTSSWASSWSDSGTYSSMQSLISFLESMPSPFASHMLMTSAGDGPCFTWARLCFSWARLANAALSSFLLSLPSPLVSASAKCSSTSSWASSWSESGTYSSMQSLISFLESMPSPFASHMLMTSAGDGPCLALSWESTYAKAGGGPPGPPGPELLSIKAWSSATVTSPLPSASAISNRALACYLALSGAPI